MNITEKEITLNEVLSLVREEIIRVLPNMLVEFN